MTKRRGRKGPSDPQDIAAERGRRLAEDRATRGTPSEWGVSAEITRLPTSRGQVEVVRDPHRRSKIVHARRSNAFELVAMSAEQQRAATRYWRDWCQRAGVITDDVPQLELVDKSPGLAPGQHLSQRMIDAGHRLDEAHAQIGRADVVLLRALVEPMVMHGEVRVWRVVVEQLTGEKERHAQAAKVRSAVENLRLAYEHFDELAVQLAREGSSMHQLRRETTARKLGI